MDSDQVIEEKRRARAAKRLVKAQQSNSNGAAARPGRPQDTERHSYLHRKLKNVVRAENPSLNELESPEGNTVKIFTWNILAQCLVRRTLFPGSDCLKWKDRGPLITREIIDYDPDIICLQEVDRLEDHGPVLSQAGYDFTHVIGGYEEEGKQHGLLIGWKRSLFRISNEKVIRLDEETFKSRRGLSRVTRNVALLCCLEFKKQSAGLYIGTSHLFWHPRFVYERTRQTAFLSRAICDFRSGNVASAHWPVFLAGDFNEEPNGPAYYYLSGIQLIEQQSTLLLGSTVVHRTVDNLLAKSGQDYYTLEGDEDRVLKDVRKSQPEDGLFDPEELKSIYGPHRWLSLYGTWGRNMKEEDANYFKDRPHKNAVSTGAPADSSPLTTTRIPLCGDYEPMWTNLTPLWRCTLDYIWILDDGPDSQHRVQVLGLLPTHRTEAMAPGLPRLGIEPSDHVALMAALTILMASEFNGRVPLTIDPSQVGE